ncbi:MAG TPA: hypothetical protein VGJ37_00320 [Pyrinomonadaceae bacterium]|jgi:predicted RNA binding protein YcfA (HicA-like mRNA interferase family)
MRILTVLLFSVVAALNVNAQGRLPMQKREIVLRSPSVYEKRVLRYDSKTGEPVYYDPKPRVVPLDTISRKYGLRWIGYDGQEKTIVYERPDAINGIVSVTVSKTSSGQYEYRYKIENLRSSKQQLAMFALQTFGDDVKPIPNGNGYVGPMTANKELANGRWFGFTSSNFEPPVLPGSSVELKVLSSEPPGMVECRIAGGQFGLRGVGEEPPQELENVLPQYEAWPRGYTVGPVQHLRSLSAQQWCDYLLRNLGEFQRLGWLKVRARGSYEQLLKSNNRAELMRRAQQDVKVGLVTSELYAMIEALQQFRP